MITISEQLRKYFITISILSIAFITITSNLSINYFFSDYIRDSRSNVDLTLILNDIIDSYEPMFKEKNIKLTKNIQDNIMIIGDIDYLKRIFINILSNAFKYTNENGRVSVSLNQIKDKIRISVSNEIKQDRDIDIVA